MTMDDSIQITQDRALSRKVSSLKKKLIFSGLGILAVVLAWFAMPPVYGRLKGMRAESFFQSGKVYLEQGKWTNALDRFELAMQMDSDQTRFRGAMARASEQIGTDQALKSWVEILRLPDVTDEERQDFTEFALKVGLIEVAGQQIKRLMVRRPPEARSLFLAAEFFRIQGDLVQASSAARAAFVAEPNDDRFQFLYGSILLALDSQEQKQEGRRLLLELAGRPGRSQVDAWRRLAGLSDLKPAESRQLINWVEASSSGLSNAVLRADLRWPSDSAVQSRRDALIAETINRTAVADDVALNELAVWLNSRKAFDSTLMVVPAIRVGTNVPLFTMRLEALSGMKRWDEAESFLQSTNVPVEPMFRLGMAAFIKSLRGDAMGERALWSSAILETTNNFRKALTLASLAERIGRNDIALRVFAPHLLISGSPAVAYEANKQTARIQMGLGELRLAHEALSRMVQGTRVDQRVKADLFYLNLLLDLQSRLTLEECLREVKVTPDRWDFRIMAALAHCRMGNAPEGLKLIQSLPVAPSLLPARWRAVVMTVYRLNGKVAEQVQLSESLSNSGFSKAELQALQSIGRK